MGARNDHKTNRPMTTIRTTLVIAGNAALVAGNLLVTAALAATPVTPRFDVFEVELAGTKSYADPFLDVTVAAEFTGPSGRKVTAHGFHDGSNVWRVRFWAWGGTPAQPDLDRFNPAFFRGLDELFRDLQARGMNVELILKLSAAVEPSALRAAGDQAGRASRTPGTSAQPTSDPSAVAGLVLGIDGTVFTLDGKKTFLLGASYYGALGAPDDFIARDFDDLRALGFNWIRVFAVWDIFDQNVSAVDRTGKAREAYISKLKAVVTAAEKRGLVVDVTLSRMPCLSNQEAHLRAVETLAKALKGCRNVYFDLANERDQNYASAARLTCGLRRDG